MATRTLVFHCTRDSVDQDFGPYLVETPVNKFVAMVREFMPRRKWIINRVDTAA